MSQYRSTKFSSRSRPCLRPDKMLFVNQSIAQPNREPEIFRPCCQAFAGQFDDLREVGFFCFAPAAFFELFPKLGIFFAPRLFDFCVEVGLLQIDAGRIVSRQWFQKSFEIQNRMASVLSRRRLNLERADLKNRELLPVNQ